MEFFFIGITAFTVAILTFFSGFGLGTLLMPVFALFFPLPLAIGATALVHLLNNVYKAFLLGSFANRRILLQFGIPSALAAFAGAYVLTLLSHSAGIFSYELAGHIHEITVVKLVIAVLMVAFALFEIVPQLQHIQFHNKYLPVGGILSGFFGGLSGHQGALRTAFLMRLGMQKNELLGSLVLIAVMVDVVRIAVYSASFFTQQSNILTHAGLQPALLAGCIGAILGSTVGKRIFEKSTIKLIQVAVSGMLLIIAVLLGCGLI